MTEITFGGFITANIRNWIIKECLQSGDPDNFFLALKDEVDNIEDEIDKNDGDYRGYWEKVTF